MDSFTPMTLEQRQFRYPGNIWQSIDTFGCHTEGFATGVQWVDAKGAANYLKINKTAPVIKDFLQH